MENEIINDEMNCNGKLPNSRRNDAIFMVVASGLMTALITIATMTVKVPIPGAAGYVHLGDAMIFLTILFLGMKYGTVSAALGSALGDIIGGYAVWAPWTLGIKGLMALVMGLILHLAFKKATTVTNAKFIPLVYIPAMLVGGIIMTCGYYFAEGIMYGNWVAALTSIPWNVTQFVVGMIVASLISTALLKTSAKKLFIYY